MVSKPRDVLDPPSLDFGATNADLAAFLFLNDFSTPLKANLTFSYWVVGNLALHPIREIPKRPTSVVIIKCIFFI